MTLAKMRQRYVIALAKHLPPSASRLRLLDIDGQCGAVLSSLRADLDIRSVPAVDLQKTVTPAAPVDAVVAYDCALDAQMLAAIAARMRPGGRFIAVLHQPLAASEKSGPADAISQAASLNVGQAGAGWLRLLQAAGLARILVERAVADEGLLIRGEKAHSTDNTLQRIENVARADADRLLLSDYRGRYLHLLIQASPNKPAWKRAPEEEIVWRALAIQGASGAVLLAFSSLPKAVAFLQPAVLRDLVRDVNKVGKFERQVAVAWAQPLTLNPTLDAISQRQLLWLHVDPASAAAPDE